MVLQKKGIRAVSSPTRLLQNSKMVVILREVVRVHVFVDAAPCNCVQGRLGCSIHKNMDSNDFAQNDDLFCVLQQSLRGVGTRKRESPNQEIIQKQIFQKIGLTN